ncbi:MAG: hypothetical protein K6E75_00835, partial [Lachnospiraceae bacterium]|nr:hypothetical protein [Lachnospiraceae bacterium]
MRRKGSLKMRLLSVVMSAAFVLTALPSGFATMQVKAAEQAGSSGNALKAIGINTDVVPEGFDEDDTESNPYGKKTIVGTVSDEVYVADVGYNGSALIGNNRTEPVGMTYTYDMDNSSEHTGGKHLL